MEYIQGETLTQFLAHRPAPPLHRKLQIIDQMCAGLHYAHRMGVVHRDIKPANIMIDTEGTVKILDFGIARMGSSGTTMMGMMIGTLNYMAPEQMEGKSVDARADIFAVGAVIYEIFSNRSAFTGSMQSEVIRDPARPAEATDRDVPRTRSRSDCHRRQVPREEGGRSLSGSRGAAPGDERRQNAHRAQRADRRRFSRRCRA